MKQQYDKIRVLWIEDLPGLGIQKADLREYKRFFEVVGRTESVKIVSVRSVEEYNALLVHHFAILEDADSRQTSPLPVEIVSADYDLSKFTPDSDIIGDKDRDFPILPPSEENISQVISNRDDLSGFYEEEYLQNVNYDDYDGCIINTMYLSEFSTHPCGSVVTTYQEPSQRHRCAKKLEEHLERCYQIDLSFSAKRTWESVLSAGVKALRRRIKHLYESGHIILLPSELMVMAEDAGHEILTMRSPYALRKLPVQGLFIDFHQDERNSAIQEWAEELLKSKVTREQFEKASMLAKRIWSNYNNDGLMNEHTKLSELHTNSQFSEKTYEDLKRKFGLDKTDRGDNTFVCTQHCSDIKSEEVACKGESQKERKKEDKIVRRWAALFLVKNLLKRVLLFIDEVKMSSKSRDGKEKIQSLYPDLEEDDILLLFYPVPTSPFPLPWHISDAKLRGNKKGAWIKWMRDNLGFEPKDLLSGLGLSKGERQILQGMVMDEDIEFGPDPEQRLARWISYEPAKLFLFGKQRSFRRSNDE